MAPPTFSPHLSDFLVHLAQHHLGKIVGFDVAKGDESADPASLFTLAPHGIDISSSSSYLSQLDPDLTLPHGKRYNCPSLNLIPSLATSFLILHIYQTFIPISCFHSVLSGLFRNTLLMISER